MAFSSNGSEVDQLTATGTFSDGTAEDLTRQASWISSNGNLVPSNALVCI
jgi:hypothetical protein